MDEIRVISGLAVPMAAADGPPVAGQAKATDFIGEALGGRVEMIVLPLVRLHLRFLDLSSRMAEQEIRKLTNYPVRAAILATSPQLWTERGLAGLCSGIKQGARTVVYRR